MTTLESVKVRYWNRMWQSAVFIPESGRVRVHLLPSVSRDHLGWAYRFRDEWYVLWNRGHALVFQVGKRQWTVGDPSVTCSNEIINRSRKFLVRRNGVSELEVSYEPVGRTRWNRGDITFDEHDELEQDLAVAHKSMERSPMGGRDCQELAPSAAAVAQLR